MASTITSVGVEVIERRRVGERQELERGQEAQRGTDEQHAAQQLHPQLPRMDHARAHRRRQPDQHDDHLESPAGPHQQRHRMARASDLAMESPTEKHATAPTIMRTATDGMCAWRAGHFAVARKALNGACCARRNARHRSIFSSDCDSGAIRRRSLAARDSNSATNCARSRGGARAARPLRNVALSFARHAGDQRRRHGPRTTRRRRPCRRMDERLLQDSWTYARGDPPDRA